MRAMKQPDHDDAHFWPAYVDALTNVILNLLFFVAVMAVCVFSLGMGAADKAHDFIRAWGMLAQKPASAQVRFHVKPVSEPEKTSRPAQIQLTPQVMADAQKIRFTFSQSQTLASTGSESAQDDARLEDLRKSLANKVATSKSQIKVWVECECRDPVDRRTAYLHVMSVRNTLIAMGAQQEKISMQMVTENVKVNNPDAIFIEWETPQSVE